MEKVVFDLSKLSETLQKEIKNSIDEVIKKFYNKKFRAGVGGIIKDDFVFWYPRFLQNISTKNLTSSLYDEIRKSWGEYIYTKIVKEGVKPSLSFKGFQTRVYRAMTSEYSEIKNQLKKIKKKDRTKFLKGKFYELKGQIKPLFYTGELLEKWQSIIIRAIENDEGQKLFYIRKLPTKTGKDSLRLELIPPKFEIGLNTRKIKYCSSYPNDMIGIFHNLGTITVPKREFLPLSIKPTKGFNFVIDTLSKDFSLIFQNALYAWRKELIKNMKTALKETSKTEEVSVEKKILEFLKEIFELDFSKEFLIKLAKELSRCSKLKVKEIIEEITRELDIPSEKTKIIINTIFQIKGE